MTGGKKTILVIEHDAAMRFALGRISLGSEITMQFSESGEWMKAQSTFVAALVDDSMLMGTEEKLPVTILAEHIDCPIILMTLSENKRINGYAKEAGASSVLRKPFNAGELRRQLGKVINGADTLLSTADMPNTTTPSGSAAVSQSSDFGGRIAGDQVFDELFVELERRQPLDANLDAFDVVERHLIKRALTSCMGNQSQAARFLGITRNTLRKRIHKYGFGGLVSKDDQLLDDGNK